MNKYVLSENGFVLTDPVKVIHLDIETKNETCLTLSEEHVRVFTVNHILVGGAPLIKKSETKTCPIATESTDFLDVITPTPVKVSPNATRK